MNAMCVFLLGLLAPTVVAAAKPNIIFVLADDLGYNEMGFMNSTRGLITPHLDALANSGVILKNYYVQPICSPTRSALMTGRYTTRLGTQANVVYWNTPWGISGDETFFSENLKEAGYETAMFGKWHLGMFMANYTPTGRGFDHHQGYYQGCGSVYTHIAACCKPGSSTNDTDYVCPQDQYTGYDWFKDQKPVLSANHTNSAWIIRDAATEFLAQASEPFFLYLPFQNIHNPYTCDQSYFDLYENNTALTAGERTVFGYISEMDDVVGVVVEHLKKNGQYDNSVIIFSSDNGAPGAPGASHQIGKDPGYIRRNYPYRGHKTLIWEGGVRVPGFVHSPLLPEAAKGHVSEKHFHVVDWLPTIVNLAGGSTQKNKQLDGFDIWDAIAHPSTPSPRNEHLYNINPLCSGGQADFPKAGIRIGDLKLLSYCYDVAGIDGKNVTGPVKAPAGAKNIDPAFYDGPVLYNITADPTEAFNLANDTRYQHDIERLLARLKTYADDMVYPMSWTPPFQGPDYWCANCPLHPPGGHPAEPWAPWL